MVAPVFALERRGDVAVLRMDDGKVNVMGPSFVGRFPAAWKEAAATNAPIVLAGNARAFSAGLDLKAVTRMTPVELEDFARQFMHCFREVLAYPRPVIAAVDGAALAGGAVFALASDLRLVTPAARLGLTEVPVGVPFPAAVLELARATLPPPEHAPAILGGAVREGEACVAHGWAHRLVARETLLDEVVREAAALGASSPVAFGNAKTQLRGAVLAAFDGFPKDGPAAWVRLLGEPESRDALARTLARLVK